MTTKQKSHIMTDLALCLQITNTHDTRPRNVYKKWHKLFLREMLMRVLVEETFTLCGIQPCSIRCKKTCKTCRFLVQVDLHNTGGTRSRNYY